MTATPRPLSFQIGSVLVDNPFILAPMAGVCDSPFRRLCRRGGAGLVCSEMVSSSALHFENQKTEEMLTIFSDEHPVSVQVFGNEPGRLAEAAKKAEAAGANIVDLNCGCPVSKIVKVGAGFSLMGDESLFSRCLEAMVKAVKIPVTVKLRLGAVRGENRAVRFVKIAEAAGVGAVTVHARAMEDRHSGPPDRRALAEAVAAVQIPVIGNGGIREYKDACEMMEETGCAAVMVGQAAMGNPFLFADFARAAQSDARWSAPNFPSENAPAPDTSARGRFRLLREHARMNVEHYGEPHGVARLRKFFPAYFRELPGAAEMRGKANVTSTLQELESIIDRYEHFLDGEAQTASSGKAA